MHMDLVFLAGSTQTQTDSGQQLELNIIVYYSRPLICIYPNECPIPEPDINLVLDQSLNTVREAYVHQR